MHPYVLLIQRVKKWAFKLALLWEFPVLTHSSAGLLQNDSAESEANFRRCKVGSWAEASKNTQAGVKMVKSKTQIENTGQSDFLLLFKEMRWAEMTSFYWDLPEPHLLLHPLSYWTLIKNIHPVPLHISKAVTITCLQVSLASGNLPCHAPSFRRLKADGLRTEGAIHSADL